MASRRQQILSAIEQATAPRADVLAFWEQGSTAMGRADELSDLDLHLTVVDGTVEAVAQAVEAALEAIGPIDLRLVVPQPSWHGHWQVFYHIAGTSPYLLIDLVIMQQSNPRRFLEPEIHGRPQLFFDKAGIAVQQPTDPAPMAERIGERIARIGARIDCFAPFVEKELRRGRSLDALAYYQSILLSSLVEVLRIRYCPWRYDFGMRYLGEDLPPAVHAQVQRLAFVADAQALEGARTRALELIRESLVQLRETDLVGLLEGACRQPSDAHDQGEPYRRPR